MVAAEWERTGDGGQGTESRKEALHSELSFPCSPFSVLCLALWALLLATAPRASGQTALRGPGASWIAPPNVAGDSFVVFHARRTFALSSVPAHFVVHTSAD